MTTSVKAAMDTDRKQFYIGGGWRGPSGSEEHEALEAATGQTLGHAALGGAEDMDAAVRAARSALDDGPWGRSTPGERADVMDRLAAALTARAEPTGRIVSQENGMPLGMSTMVNGHAPAGLLSFYAHMARSFAFEEIRPGLRGGSTLVIREPVGVVAAITPWNYPQLLAMYKIAPALAAGCTVVLKPSPETALDSYVLADAAAEAGLPPGVLNIVLGGREAGAALVSHPLVDKVAFTGSTAAGRLIGAECGRLVRRVTLELGGKSASIVLDDADMDAFSAGLGINAFANNGQTCTTQSRILAPRSRYDEVVEAVASYAAALVVGNPLDADTTLGPMASEAHAERVLRYVAIARNSSARLVTGGGRPKGLDRGWFVEPTVFADVDNGDVLAREEVFGPVIAVIPYGTDEDAVRMANDSEYGLGGSVWTQDPSRGIGVARRVRTGMIGVNNFNVDLNAPFGGMKDSGIGRELGPEGLGSYLEFKSMFLDSGVTT